MRLSAQAKAAHEVTEYASRQRLYRTRANEPHPPLHNGLAKSPVCKLRTVLRCQLFWRRGRHSLVRYSLQGAQAECTSLRKPRMLTTLSLPDNLHRHKNRHVGHQNPITPCHKQAHQVKTTTAGQVGTSSLVAQPLRSPNDPGRALSCPSARGAPTCLRTRPVRPAGAGGSVSFCASRDSGHASNASHICVSFSSAPRRVRR